MAELFSKQAAVYAAVRPDYPKDLFAKLAAATGHHRLAWDVGTGNGQAAISGGALRQRGGHGHERGAAAARRAAPEGPVPPHPRRHAGGGPRRRARWRRPRGPHHGGAAAQAVHWFDLPAFYAVARRVLRRPGGVIAVWGYNYRVSPVEDLLARFLQTTLPYRDPRSRLVIDGYRDLPFPFVDIGLGREGEPMSIDMEHEMSFEGLVSMLRSTAPVTTAKQQGVDLLGERVVKEMEEEWGGASLVRKVAYKAFLLAGTLSRDD
ncbi:hypothetical protein ACP70R_014791 [Stipagrostis hirtigluma subsp. patula]